MTHSIIPADQLAKVREVLTYSRHATNHGQIAAGCREALSILDSLQEVEVLGWTTHDELEFLDRTPMRSSAMLFNFTEPDDKFIPLYGSKT